MSIVLVGSTSGSITLQEPAVAGSTVLSLPATTGTVLTSASPSSDLPSSINGPAFSATGTGQSLSTSTWTKIQFSTEQFDTASCFDSSTNYRFTPNVAGYYQINLSAGHGASGNPVLGNIYKNGTAYQGASSVGLNAVYDPTVCISAVIYFNGSTDYVEGYIITNTNTTTQSCRFSGSLTRAA